MFLNTHRQVKLIFWIMFPSHLFSSRFICFFFVRSFKKKKMEGKKRKVGIVGYGSLGKYLAKAILEDKEVSSKLELCFVWNRSFEKVEQDPLIPAHTHLRDLSLFDSKGADVIIEVSHPQIVGDYGESFVRRADFVVGSPTAFAEASVEHKLREAARKSLHGVYIPSGALWGAQDIHKMGERGDLKGVEVSMAKHPSSLKLEGELKEALEAYKRSSVEKPCVLFEGPVRVLCPLAPNNTNTMACAALAASNLGFDKTVGKLVADKSLQSHDIDITVEGPNGFSIHTRRINPAAVGAVTGNATYASFLSSLVRAQGQGNGFHFC